MVQAQGLIDDEERQEEYNGKLNQKWKNLKKVPIIGPAITESVKGDTGTLGGDLETIGIGSGGSATDLIASVVSEVGAFVTTGITVLFFLIFIIFEAHLLPGRIERAWPGSSTGRVEVIQTQIEEGINSYIIVKTGCGLGSAFIAAIIMLMFDIDLWFVWAVMTFILNYVPYIGSLIATIPPLILGIILLKPSMLLLMTILLLVNQQVWGNYIETKWAGRALDLSPCIFASNYCILILAVGYCWNDFGSSSICNRKDCTRKHRRNPTYCNFTIRKSSYFGRSMARCSERWKPIFRRVLQTIRVTKVTWCFG